MERDFLGFEAFSIYAYNSNAFYVAKEFILQFFLNINDIMYAI